ncbi:MAG: hypothetical protein MHPSP_000347 [Paramarteilia canceri]
MKAQNLYNIAKNYPFIQIQANDNIICQDSYLKGVYILISGKAEMIIQDNRNENCITDDKQSGLDNKVLFLSDNTETYEDFKANSVNKLFMHIKSFGKFEIFSMLMRRFLDGMQNTRKDNKSALKERNLGNIISRAGSKKMIDDDQSLVMRVYSSQKSKNSTLSQGQATGGTRAARGPLASLGHVFLSVRAIESAVASRIKKDVEKLTFFYDNLKNDQTSILERKVRDWYRDVSEDSLNDDEESFDEATIKDSKKYESNQSLFHGLSNSNLSINLARSRMKQLPFIENLDFHKDLLNELGYIVEE